jgi:hypothetical protein
MNRRLIIAALLAVAASTGATFAADPRYPDWPCAQAKVPEISVAAVWAGPPLDDIREKWKDDPKISALVGKLSVRRTPLDEAEKAVTEFMSGTAASEKATTGKLLFAGLFETLNAQRASASPDQAKIDDLGNQLTWETRIFEDRRRVVKFVCEVPTAIDQRLFALGRAIQQDME